MIFRQKTFREKIEKHYKNNWKASGEVRHLREGPYQALGDDFCILEFKPTFSRTMWTYATCCMSHEDDVEKVELHLFSAEKNDSLVELLTVVAHYHRTGEKLGLGHTVNFGRGWLDGSECGHGLVSLPYLDGPKVENLDLGTDEGLLRCYWLVPIHQKELDFKKTCGLEALEQKLEEASFDYLDQYRSSVI